MANKVNIESTALGWIGLMMFCLVLNTCDIASHLKQISDHAQTISTDSGHNNSPEPGQLGAVPK